MLTQERLKEVLSYDQGTGLFSWRNDMRNGSKAGQAAGWVSVGGYVYIGIDRAHYRAHRLAWLYVHGEFPKFVIDHANGVATDNRISNLRPATQTQNMHNKRAAKSSKTGVKGVCYCSSTGRYQVKITVDGKYKHIGRYDTVEEGAAAYAEAAKRYHGEFARTA